MLMFDTLPETIEIDTNLMFFALLAMGAIALLAAVISFLPRVLKFISERFISVETSNFSREIVAEDRDWLILFILLMALDLAIWTGKITLAWLYPLEIFIGLAIAFLTCWLGWRFFRRYFDSYLLNTALNTRRKVNSEIFLLSKLAANAGITLVVIFVYAQIHHVNLFGLLASLGVGGLAVAFAAQKSLEQLLGGIVLYVDRPFVIDDYIGLPDGTFGRVESIGWRSTKIRTSGKGTLVIVPNNALTQTSIENYTGAKKIISMIYVTFFRPLSMDEQALCRQVILEGTRDIFGLDPRSTEITFKDTEGKVGDKATQAQVSFFILGSGEVSMDLRRQLLDAAKQNISVQLKVYGIDFHVEAKTVNVDSPITI